MRLPNLCVIDHPPTEAQMNTYQATSRKARIAAAALSLTVVAALLEVVASGFLHPNQESVAARQQVIAAQAEQVARSRALSSGEVKSAEAGAQARI